MCFWVKLIEVKETSCSDARNDLNANCCHVSKNYWLFEGDVDALHKGIDFHVVGEEAIEGFGDLKGSQVIDMVIENYYIEALR